MSSPLSPGAPAHLIELPPDQVQPPPGISPLGTLPADRVEHVEHVDHINHADYSGHDHRFGHASQTDDHVGLQDRQALPEPGPASHAMPNHTSPQPGPGQRPGEPVGLGNRTRPDQPQPNHQDQAALRPAAARLNSKYTFETFVIGAATGSPTRPR